MSLQLQHKAQQAFDADAALELECAVDETQTDGCREALCSNDDAQVLTRRDSLLQAELKIDRQSMQTGQVRMNDSSHAATESDEVRSSIATVVKSMTERFDSALVC